MNGRSLNSKRATSALAAMVFAALLLSACSSPPEDTGANRKFTPTPPPEATSDATPAPPASPLAVAKTEWPGLEARLMRCIRSGNILTIEVLLANTGNAPVSIEHYSAASATMTSDVSAEPVGVFEPAGRTAATTDLSQTLQPGDVAAVNVVFPVAPQAKSVSVTLPRIDRFENVPVNARPATEPERPDGEGNRRGREGSEPPSPPATSPSNRR